SPPTVPFPLWVTVVPLAIWTSSVPSGMWPRLQFAAGLVVQSVLPPSQALTAGAVRSSSARRFGRAERRRKEVSGVAATRTRRNMLRDIGVVLDSEGGAARVSF